MPAPSQRLGDPCARHFQHGARRASIGMGAGRVGPAVHRIHHRRLGGGQHRRGRGMVKIEALGSHDAMLLIDCGNGGGFYIGGLPRSASLWRGARPFATDRRPDNGVRWP